MGLGIAALDGVIQAGFDAVQPTAEQLYNADVVARALRFWPNADLDSAAIDPLFGNGGNAQRTLSGGGGVPKSAVIVGANLYFVGSDNGPGNAQWRIQAVQK